MTQCGPSASHGRRCQNVLCSSPPSLHVYGTRTCPWSAETRFSAPHFRHLLSIRVLPCLTVRVLRSNASFTKRSVSSRIACFDISRFLILRRFHWERKPFVNNRNACWIAVSESTEIASE